MDPVQRARRVWIVAWVVVALVPIAIFGGYLGGKYLGRALGLSLLVTGVVAELASPLMLVVTGHRLRQQQAPPSSPTLGRVAIGLYVLMVIVVGTGVVYIVRATQDGSMMGLGMAVGGAFLVLLSLLPWLGSVITGGVFAGRILRTLVALACLPLLSASTLA